MNVYDFDNTILRGDSTARFFAYCLARYPRMWADIPAQAVNALLFILKIRKKQAFKERMLAFLRRVPDIDSAVGAFWDKNMPRVKAFYAKTRRDDDVVISASPEFLIRPACDRLGIRTIIGSPVDKFTGRFSGPNCHDREKVRRFREMFPNGRIDEFYSDSYSDSPLAEISKRAYLVKGERLSDWGRGSACGG